VEYLDLRQKLKQVLTHIGKMDELLSNVPEVLKEVLFKQEEFAQPLKQYINSFVRVKMEITGTGLLQLGFKEGRPLDGHLEMFEPLA
jgi:hypothetical protein